ncbi:CRP/FNR family transcriptional regulator, anaerobic regulatory protein [Pseudomonas linyingensis]|uniref:CRP/FNR family transcriptional regulator, anaerobic regulatory protein n=1 Tax=Pseudomonas linyingensis TaxID=915471 RepID=A0A1H6ZE12_9PSED|nr:fumarate/nitrate reduction transcriptional regulator Fnr [Pseudomonas linyingensis]SEJ47760.1 CRP/FNR family transcriptional regulator, anaerobic regulatory protein [Pseudomonas linyingensis]
MIPENNALSPSGRCSRERINCRDCSIRPHCFPANLQGSELQQLDGIILRSRPLQKGEPLFDAGTPLHYFHAVRSGALKTYLLSREGEEQITGFHLPGEILGLDGMGASSHPGFAVALETSMVCSIPLARLEELAGSIPHLRAELLWVMSAAIHADHQQLRLTRKPAAERLAAFLLELSQRFLLRGYSAQNFILPMSRCEIANYLGLTSETVSRLFTRYRDRGLVEIRGREVLLKDVQRLQQLCGLCAAALADE